MLQERETRLANFAKQQRYHTEHQKNYGKQK